MGFVETSVDIHIYFVFIIVLFTIVMARLIVMVSIMARFYKNRVVGGGVEEGLRGMRVIPAMMMNWILN